MTIKELQEKVDEWIQKYGVRYFNELTNMTMLTEEVGELSRLMARTYGEQSYKAGKEPENTKASIADELSDIIFVLTCMANQMEINLEEAIEKNIIKKINRLIGEIGEGVKLKRTPDQEFAYDYAGHK